MCCVCTISLTLTKLILIMCYYIVYQFGKTCGLLGSWWSGKRCNDLCTVIGSCDRSGTQLLAIYLTIDVPTPGTWMISWLEWRKLMCLVSIVASNVDKSACCCLFLLSGSFIQINIILPAHIIKQRIKSYLWEHFTSHFNTDQTCSFHLLCPCYRCSRVIPTNFNFGW